MDLGLDGSVVAVFGAARGIGAAIARAFADESARVAAIDRDAFRPGGQHAVLTDNVMVLRRASG